MVRFLSAFLVAILLCVQSMADTECPYVVGAPSQPHTGFRLVQYNAEWLFMDYYSPMKCPGSGCTWANDTEAYTHIEYVASVVSKLKPDIMNVCEVEGCDELNLLRFKVDGGDAYQVNLKSGTDTATGQNVGLVTRWSPIMNLTRTEEKYAYPIAGSKCGYSGSGGSVGVSKHYITAYEWYNRSVLFVGAHLLAYPEDATRCAEREAQAQIIQNVVAKYVSVGWEAVVIGDFNDFDGTVLDTNRNVPTSRVLDILKGNAGKYAGMYTLRSVAEKISQVERFTDWWDQNGDCVSTANEFSMIDHVLVTPFLFDKIGNAFVYHGYDEFCGKYNSDHYPVVVDFI